MRLDSGAIQVIDGEYWAIGPEDPFTGVNQDLFTFEVDNENQRDGETVLKYAGSRAFATWPGEVLPLKGWNSLEKGYFGGYSVDILPEQWMDWYLSRCYGPKWKSHDGFGNEIKDFSCRKHSNMILKNMQEE